MARVITSSSYRDSIVTSKCQVISKDTYYWKKALGLDSDFGQILLLVQALGEGSFFYIF